MAGNVNILGTNIRFLALALQNNTKCHNFPGSYLDF